MFIERSLHEKADNLLELSTGREVIKVHIELSIIDMTTDLDFGDRVVCFSFGRRGRQDSVGGRSGRHFREL